MEPESTPENEVSKDIESCMDVGSSKPDMVGEHARVRRYSRSEIEALRFVDITELTRKWSNVYEALGREYDGLCASDVPKKQNSKRNKNANKQTKAAAKKQSETCSLEVVKDDSVGFNICEDAYSEPFEAYEEAGDGDGSSSDESYSIQRPAFYVEGEPDFESGPPLDGLEYLRRVRWEAARIPKVKVVKLEANKVTSEQTPYMPKIPECAMCPPNLLPSKQWEDTFLADFAELRQAISLLEEPCEQSIIKETKDLHREPNNTNSLSISSILSMDVVSRSTALRKSISMLETCTSLSRDDCVRIFSLCASVDTPLSAETCASLRILLRKCYSLLALKLERDDEVAMLSILVAIAGKYFKQSDNL